MTRTPPHQARLPWLPESTHARVLLAGLWVAGLWLRLADVGPALLFGDELHSLRDMLGGYSEILGRFSGTGGGLALPLLQRGLMDLFGDSHWVIRAPAWIPGAVLLLVVFPIARRPLGESAALAATALVAVSPLLIFYAHFGRIYSLVALLSLLLYHCLASWERRAHRDPRAGAWIVVLTALLPWAHPTALGIVLPLYLGAMLAFVLEPAHSRSASRRAALHLAGALAFAGILCLLSYWPAHESLAAFLDTKTREEYYGAFGPLDVASLATGTRAGFVLLAGLAGAGLLGLLRHRRHVGILLGFAALGPPLTIALVQPYGDAYAYARYAMPGLVPLCLLAGSGWVGLLGRVPGLSASAPAWGAAALAAALWLAGPLGPGNPRVPEHANTYLSMRALPSFEIPWPETPNFYRELAALPAGERAGLRLVEVPALTTRTRHLYRHYQAQHGVESWVAPLPGEFPRIPHGPYIAFQRPDWRETSGADYLVVHLDIAGETAAYWRWLYGADGPGPFDKAQAAFMERHQRYGGLLPAPSDSLLSSLAAQLGEPRVSDPGLLVWDLRPPAGGAD
ncbi:MAG: glycosyltransferase family 39 protein [Myxococcota bacterium]|nr:glycosyltransferase family 39 protein [Myxococcota bacterium]